MRERLFVFLLAFMVSIYGLASPTVGANQPPAFQAASVDTPKPGLYLVSNEVLEFELGAAKRIDGFDVEEVHSYGPSRLLYVRDLSGLSAETLSKMTALDDTSVVQYGPWVGTADVRDLGQGEDGYYIVSLVAPASTEWVSGLESRGLKFVDTAWPYGFVVRGNARALEGIAASKMSSGADLVRGIQPVRLESRVEPELLAVAQANKRADEIPGLRRSPDGRMVIRVVGYADQPEARVVRQVSRFADPAGEAGFGYPDAFLVNGPEVLEILDKLPGVAWIETVHERRLTNNLAAKAGALDIEPMWTAGWNGTGVRVNHNDGGVDINGVGGVTAFPTGVVTATAGNHSNTDNAHGTHTAGSVLGRPLSVTAPTGTSGCGDLTTKLPDARGMAWGATLNTNNLFDPGSTGKTTEDTMMKWAQDNSSHISTNSWGYISSYTYGSQAVTIDRAVRDADTTEAGNQALTILFAAGNDGSGAGTVGNPGTGKNAITVGASHNLRCGSYPSPGTLTGNLNTVVDFSGRGPSQGRIKPDILAIGANVLSVASDDPGTFGNSPDSHGWDEAWTGANYELMPGTSMATPIAAGATADFFQFYQTTFGVYPSPALTKAALINGAVAMSGYTYENTATGTYAQGWGRLNLKNTIQGPTGGSIKFKEQDTAAAVTTGVTRTYTFSVSSSSVPLKLSLVWTDPPGASGSSAPLRNNLDLIVTAPNGTVYRGNRFTGVWSTANPGATTDTANNVENVFVQSPATGTWTVQVVGTNVTTNVTGITGQDFAVVHSGAVTDLVTGGGGSPDFALSSSPASVSIAQGSSGTSTITSTISGGFNSAVALSASGLPSGATASFSPASIAAPGSGSSTMTITVGAATPTGTSTITVTGTGGSLTRTTTVSLTVTTGSSCSSNNGPITAGTPANGTLATTDCASTIRTGGTYRYDNYTFSATAGTAYTITLNSSAYDTYLYLLSGSTILAQDDDGNGGTNSKIVYTPTASGTLTIHATSYSANATGAYTVSLTGSSGPVTVLTEGAESGATGWTVSTNTTGNNWVVSANGRATGANGFRTNNATATYTNNLDQSLISPSFSLAGKTSASLTYFAKRQTESTYDFFIVEVSTNGGSTWTQLSSVSGSSSGFTTTAGSAMLSNTVSLTSYAGQANVKIRFRLTSDVSVVQWGAAVDDITVTAQ